MKFSFPHLTSFEDAQRNFEQIEAAGLFVGSGAPTFPAQQGNYYLRTDTPSTSGQQMYVNTAQGANWQPLLATPTVAMPTRVLGTVYQPSATRPTLVTMVITASATGSGAQFFSDASNPPTTERTRVYSGSASGPQMPMTALVLPGHYYKAGVLGTASVLETAEWTL